MRFVLIALLLISNSYAQSIQFIEGSKYDSIINNKSTKLIFIDFYTTWCGPCKRMDIEVLNDSLVSKQINTSFNAFKIDAEQGYGIALAKKFNITSYPTYLFLNADGIPVYRTIGYMSVDDFRIQITNALLESKESKTVLHLDSLYKEFRNDTVLVRQYLLRRTKLKLDNADLLDEYFKLLSEEQRARLHNLQIVVDNGSRLNKSLQIGTALETLIANQKQLRELKNALPIDFYIDNARKKTLQKAIEQNNDSLLQLVLKYTPNQDYFINHSTIKLDYYHGIGNKNKFYGVAKELFSSRKTQYSLGKILLLDSIALDEILRSDDFKDSSPQELLEVKADYKHTQSVQLIRQYNFVLDFLLRFEGLTKEELLQFEKWATAAVNICAVDTGYFKFIYPHSLNNLAKITYLLNFRSKAIDFQRRAIQSILILEEQDNLELYKKQLGIMKTGKKLQ